MNKDICKHDILRRTCRFCDKDYQGTKTVSKEEYDEIKRLKAVIHGANSLFNEIFESIPHSFMTGYEWDKQWNEIKKEGGEG